MKKEEVRPYGIQDWYINKSKLNKADSMTQSGKRNATVHIPTDYKSSLSGSTNLEDGDQAATGKTEQNG